MTTIVSVKTQIAYIDSNMEVGKPGELRRSFLFQHGVIVMVPPKGPPKKNDTCVRQGHDRVFQRVLFFSRGHAPAVWPHLVTDDTPVRWHQ